jgi:predicted peroxiredoxin
MKRALLAGLIAALAVVVLVTVSCQQAQIQDHGKDGMFFHIKSNDAHKVIMPLSLGTKMLEDDVNLAYFFDIEGVHAVVKGSEAFTKEGFDMDSHQALQKLMGNNVGLYVCPMCLKAAGYTKEDLMEGVGIMEKEVFFNFTDGRILTLDY